jgi:hypothetical protein
MSSKPDFLKELKQQDSQATREQLEAAWQEELERRAQQAEREDKRLAAEAEREDKRQAAEAEREFELEKLRIAKQSIGAGTFSCRSCNLIAVCSRVSLLAAVVCVLVLGFCLSHFLHFLCLPIQQEV